MSKLEAHQRPIARVCFDRAVSDDALALLGGNPQRWLVYRDLVRNRLWSALREAMPRTFPAAGAERFGRWFEGFLEAAPPRTRFVREVAPAFAAWVLETEGEGLSHPSPWLSDALSFDLAELHVALSAARLDPVRVTEFAMDLPAALDPTHRRLRMRWACEEGVVRERPRVLLLHRHATLVSVEVLVLDSFGAALLDALDDGTTPVTEAVRAVLLRHDLPADEALAESLATLLGDLMERGVLLGSCAV